MAKSGQSNDLVNSLMSTKLTIDAKMKQSKLNLLNGITFEDNSKEKDMTRRRKVDSLCEGDGVDDEYEDSEISSSSSEESASGREKQRRKKSIRRKMASSSVDSSEEEEEEMKLLAGTKQRSRKPLKRGNNRLTKPSESSTNEEIEATKEEAESLEEEERDAMIEDFLDIEAEEGEVSEEEEEEEMSDECDEGEEGFVIEECREQWQTKKEESDTTEGGTSTFDEKSEMEQTDEEECEDESEMPKWKKDLTRKANESFHSRQQQSRSSYLRALIYGETRAVERPMDPREEGGAVGGLFHVRVESKSKYDNLDTSLVTESHAQQNLLQLDWSDEAVIQSVKSLFVTGSWGDDDAEKLLKADDDNEMGDIDDDDLYGDFEDMETGVVHKVGEGQEAGPEEDQDGERKKKKEKLKKEFDLEYDDKEEVCTPSIIA